MSNLQIFNFENKDVRTIGKDGDPWFVAKDVAEVLGYSDTDQAIRKHCKCAELLKAVDSTGLEINSRGMIIIPERDIYRLVMKSKLPAAEKFENWVVSDVLPTIRKTGKYDILESRIPRTLPEALRAYANEVEKNELLLIENNKKQELIIKQEPKVAAFETFIGSKDCLGIGVVAKVLGKEFKLGEKRLFKILRENKVLDSNNVAYQKYIDSGYFTLGESYFKLGSETKLRTSTRVTTKGQDWIRKNISNNKWDL